MLSAPSAPPPRFERAAECLWTVRIDGPGPASFPVGAPGSAPSVRIAGRLTNQADLRRELHLPANVDDAALVAAAYGRWGLDFCRHLRGAFALVVTDPPRRRTIVARDQIGLRPIFYTVDDAAVHFADTPQALVAAAVASSALNRVALADAVCRRYPDAEETFFADVRRLPAGTQMLVEGGRTRIHRYWDPIAARPPRPDQSEDDAYEEFTALQRQAVRRCLGEGTTGVFLSGGLDSVSIAAAATDGALGRLTALSMSFAGTPCDEQAVQESVARALRMPQILLPLDDALGGRTLLDHNLDLSARLISPLRNYWHPAYLQLAHRGRSAGVSTILTGHGGDEWLMAPTYTLADLLGRGRLFAARGFMRTWKRSEDASGVLWRYGLRPWAGRIVGSIAPGWWDRNRAGRLWGSDPAWASPDAEVRAAQLARAAGALGAAAPPRGFAAAEREAIWQAPTSHMDHEENATMGRLVGVDYAHPYHDVDLIEFQCSLPAAVSSAGGWLRGMTRRQLAARFPDVGFERQRKLLATEYHRTTLERSATALMQEAPRFPMLEQLQVVDGRRLRQAAAGTTPVEVRRLWDLAVLESWARAQTGHQFSR